MIGVKNLRKIVTIKLRGLIVKKDEQAEKIFLNSFFFKLLIADYKVKTETFGRE